MYKSVRPIRNSIAIVHTCNKKADMKLAKPRKFALEHVHAITTLLFGAELKVDKYDFTS